MFGAFGPVAESKTKIISFNCRGLLWNKNNFLSASGGIWDRKYLFLVCCFSFWVKRTLERNAMIEFSWKSYIFPVVNGLVKVRVNNKTSTPRQKVKSRTRSSNLNKLLSLMASVGAERIILLLLCDTHYLPWTAATQLTAAPPENNNAFIISL